MNKCILCNSSNNKLLFVKQEFNILKCRNCELVFVGNPPSTEELEKLYSFEKGFHDVFLDDDSPESKFHKKLSKYYFEVVSEFIMSGKILDIGCSVGYFLNFAKEAGWDTFGIEMSKDTAQIAQTRYGLDVRIQGIDQINYEKSFFDVITLWDVIEHLENPLESMKKVSGFVKVNGLLFISTPNIDGLYPRVSYWFSKIINHWRHPEPPYHLFQFSKKTLSELLFKSGFEVIKLIDLRIQMKYTFGSFKDIRRSPKKLLYAFAFIPLVIIGPLVNMGDTMIVIAKKK